MKLSCLKQNLWKSLTIVSKALNSKTTLPILSNILIKTDQGRLKLVGTDLEIGITSWLGAKIDQEGEIAIPSKLFLEYINSLKDEKIDLQSTETHLKVKTKNNISNIKFINSSEFPSIPKINEESEIITIKGNQLKNGLENVFFAATHDETRPALNGVLLKILDKKINFVATDSYRLAQKEIKNNKIKNESEVIIPNKTTSEIIRILQYFPDIDIKIGMTQNQIFLKIEDEVEIVSRLIEGGFPAYEQIIPSNFQSTIIINRNELLDAIKLTNLFAKENSNNLKLEINPQDKTVIVSATSTYLGDASSTIEANIEGDGLDIAFNARYLTDVLMALNNDNIQLNFSGKLSPAVVTIPGSDEYHYVIMPLRI